MLGIRKVALMIAPLFVAVAMVCSTGPQKAGSTIPKGKNIEAGEALVRQLLFLMDRDKNGKISKQEYMSFMEAEFDRLDTNHDGELEPKELEQTHLRWAGK